MDYRNLLRQAANSDLGGDGGGGGGDDSDGDDGDRGYRPPTEAQMKVLKARRERSDKIAKRMGECLLAGWRMLDQVCQNCDTILLQPTGDASGSTYCIACRELESDVSKDDPATSADAARTQAREAEAAAASAPNPRPNPAPKPLANLYSNERAKPTTSSPTTARALCDLRLAALNRLDFYRLRLLSSDQPADTERVLATLERLLGFVERLGPE